MAGPVLDERDAAFQAERAEWLSDRSEPGVGDFLFYGDVVKRIAHVWDFKDGSDVTVQPTSGTGSFYLGRESISYSGGLETGIDVDRLTELPSRKHGKVWFFHHDYATAHNGVDVLVPFKVWAVS